MHTVYFPPLLTKPNFDATGGGMKMGVVNWNSRSTESCWVPQKGDTVIPLPSLRPTHGSQTDSKAPQICGNRRWCVPLPRVSRWMWPPSPTSATACGRSGASSTRTAVAPSTAGSSCCPTMGWRTLCWPPCGSWEGDGQLLKDHLNDTWLHGAADDMTVRYG